MNAIVNIGTLALTAWSVADLFKGQEDPDKATSVAMLTGIAPNGGGSVPHVAIWDEKGNRIGQYTGDANGHIDENGSKTVTIWPTQNHGHQATPEYLLMVMQEDDAVCISAIVVQGNGVQWSWTGDMAYTCDGQWYPSKRTIGSSNAPVRCAWFDKDHSNNIVAKGVSLHMRDFSGDQGLVDQYSDDQRRLCQNTARMTLQPEPILPDSMIKFFDPVLEYDEMGALKNPDQGIDRGQRGYPDYTDFSIHDTKRKRSHPRDLPKPSRNSTVVGKNNMPGRLVISNIDGHSAQELCDHPNSFGPDFVSKREMLYCDMSEAKLWPVCDATHSDGCFDLETKTLRNFAPGSIHARSQSVPEKEYHTHEEW